MDITGAQNNVRRRSGDFSEQFLENWVEYKKCSQIQFFVIILESLSPILTSEVPFYWY